MYRNSDGSYAERKVFPEYDIGPPFGLNCPTAWVYGRSRRLEGDGRVVGWRSEDDG